MRHLTITNVTYSDPNLTLSLHGLGSLIENFLDYSTEKQKIYQDDYLGTVNLKRIGNSHVAFAINKSNLITVTGQAKI